MSLLDELRSVGSILLLDRKEINRVAKQHDATYYAISFFIVIGLAVAGLNLWLFPPTELMLPLPYLLVVIAVIVLLFELLASVIFHVTALLFKGSGTILGLFRIFGYLTWLRIGYFVVSLPEFMRVLPSPDLPLWSIIALLVNSFYTVYAVRTVEDLSTSRALLVYVLPIIVFGAFALLISLALMSILLRPIQ
ncbi:hypothetical protein HY639_04965 [Candidatus Woesearchaeota archaeon]|nr:hypothetical protein [Candidatus Woesearchaeota archaeon]